MASISLLIFSPIFKIENLSKTFIITMLPSINGVGVREYGFVFFLAAVNVSSAAAISLSVMNVLIPMFISVWGGLLFFTQRKNSKINEVKAIEKNL